MLRLYLVLFAYLGKSHLRTAVYKFLVYKLTVAETVIDTRELITLALISQVLDVIEYGVSHDYLVGILEHLLNLFVKLIELGLTLKVFLAISELYLGLAVLPPKIEARGGIHDYIPLFNHIKIRVGNHISERTHLALAVETVGAFYIVKQISHKHLYYST